MAPRTDQLWPWVTINKLPDEVLLEIFDFYIAYPLPPPSYEEDAWHTLVHVCQRWRYVVLGSPCRLDLRILCVDRRLVKSLDIWPELPIAIHVDNEETCKPPTVTNVISVLQRHNRIRRIFVDSVTNSLLEELAKTSGPFPALIELELASFKEDPPMLPDSFLGGSAPRLRSLNLWGIPFPGIGKLLLSTRDLVTLSLGFIPESGYISPDAMVTTLSALTRLKTLHLSFEFPQFWIYGASQRSPALTRVLLPALTDFNFSGDSEYLEELVSRIDAPLDCIAVTFFDQPVFDIPLLHDFIGRIKILSAPHRVDTSFSHFRSRISFFERRGDIDFQVLHLEMPCSSYTLDSQLSSFAQACGSLLSSLPSLEHLGIYKCGLSLSQWEDEVRNTQWIELLRPFTAVKNLVLDEAFVLSVGSALQDLVGERVTEILPALQNIFLESFKPSDPIPEGIAKFVAARELYGRSVFVHHRERKQ